MHEWCLKVRFLDTTESASFSSRQDALEYAKAVVGDYDGSVEVTITGPSGQPENVPQLMLASTQTQ